MAGDREDVSWCAAPGRVVVPIWTGNVFSSGQLCGCYCCVRREQHDCGEWK